MSINVDWLIDWLIDKWQLQLNQTGLAICVQVFDWSTTVVIAENTMSQKQCSEWPLPALTDIERRRRHWCTAAAMHTSNLYAKFGRSGANLAYGLEVCMGMGVPMGMGFP